MRPLETSEPFDRREFFRTALRYVALTGAAGALATAVARRAPLTGPACGGDGVCRGCALLAECGEARADAARRRAPTPEGAP